MSCNHGQALKVRDVAEKALFAVAEKRRVKMVLEDLTAKDLWERNIAAVYLRTQLTLFDFQAASRQR